ncbi:hypothetical protein HNQ92_003024 [Rhabdobacter roseus]|uniref:TonB-dependent receptor plug domain-containing protein n=1 Tax=Rhabdobacter roseus TaxID=1655419 RepID=A0A840TL15_9BACT|nr:TonB-dependent receptor [Rhabdobacter roseus]MBB5284876.1 hypothetical protein [Rhabdobacter roseus]
MQKYTFLSILSIGLGMSFAVVAQTIHLNGYITDSHTGEVLIGATINYPEKKINTISNKYGYYTLLMPPGNSQLKISCIGYRSFDFDVYLSKDTTLPIALTPESIELSEVVIQEKSTLSQTTAGFVTIPISRLKSVPILFGEADLIKALALTPGVTTGNEGTTGLLVRGGTPDQNLILLDDAIVYNTAHLFGLVSVFNTDAVKNVEMYKAGFPARYGGRLSSVFDITMKEGNKKRHNKELTVGLISSRMLWEGPLSYKEKHYGKSSYLIAARSSYLTAFLLPKYLLFKAGKARSYFNYWLYDVNAKINHQFGPKSQIFASLYHGNDFYSAEDGLAADRSKFGLNWGNTTFTVRYNHILHPRLFLKSILSYSRYHFDITAKSFEKKGRKWEEANALQSLSMVNDWTHKSSLEWFVRPRQTIRFGVQTSLYFYLPTSLRTSFDLPADSLLGNNASISTHELSAFTEYEFMLGSWFKSNVGGRLVRVNVQEKTYQNLEPRISANLIVTGDMAVKVAYTRMNQYTHLLTSNSVGLPNDVWVPATETIKPASSEQYALGLSKTIGTDIEISIDVYKKSLKNLIDYSTGTGFFSSFDQSWQSLIEQDGVGRIRGLEVFINKTKGAFTGWAGYTLSKNERKFDRIDEGAWYASNFDRRHVLSLVGNYTHPIFNYSFSLSWVYQSGAPVSMPIAIYKQLDEGQFSPDGSPTLLYGNRNNVRLPAYHKLDLSYSFDIDSPKRRTARMTFGVYNAYNRVNPYYLRLRIQPYPASAPTASYSKYQGFTSSVNKVGVLPLLPYVSYSVKL